MSLLSLLSFFATTMLVIFIILIIYRQRIGWIFGSIGWGVYCFVLFQTGLFFQSGLQVYYIAMGAYGFIAWTRNQDGSGVLIVDYWRSRLTNFATFAALIAIAFSASSIIAIITQKDFSGIMFADASIAAVAVFATYLQTRSKIEGWYYWIFVNTLVTVVAFLSSLYFLALLGMIMVVMNIYGSIQWRKQYDQQEQQPLEPQ